MFVKNGKIYATAVQWVASFAGLGVVSALWGWEFGHTHNRKKAS